MLYMYNFFFPERVRVGILMRKFVADPPEISVERPVVHSGEGAEAQLVCIVHGESQPEVSTDLINKGNFVI